MTGWPYESDFDEDDRNFHIDKVLENLNIPKKSYISPFYSPPQSWSSKMEVL